mgnify:CR=1 FL=1
MQVSCSDKNHFKALLIILSMNAIVNVLLNIY